MPTYDELLNDDTFSDSVYYLYTELGKDIPETRQELVDDFLSQKRYFEDNLVGTFDFGGDLKNLSDQGKIFAGYAFNQVDALPTIFEEGSAPVADAIFDHIKYSVADPTNLLGLVAGAFSFGAGTGAVMGGKVAAQQAAKTLLSNRVKALLGTYAVDSLASGAGGVVRENEIQNVEQDIGVRDEKDLGQIALAGAIEGPAAVLGGSLLGLGARGVGKAGGVISRAAYDALPTSTQRSLNRSLSLIQKGIPLIRSGGGLDEDIMRRSEMIAGDRFTFADRAQKLEKEFRANNTYKDLTAGGQNDILRAAFEGRPGDITKIEATDKNLADLFKDYRTLVGDLQQYSSAVSGLSENVAKNFDKLNPKYNPYYTRLTYDAFEKGPSRKVKFNDFLSSKPQVLDDLYTTIRDDALRPEADTNKFFEKFGISQEFLKKNPTLPTSYVPQIKSLANDMYEGKIGDYEYSGALLRKRKQDDEFPKVFQELFGKNADPASTVFATTRGIIEPISQLHMANEVGRILEAKGQAVLARDANEAATKIFNTTGTLPDAKKLKNVFGGAFPVKGGLRNQAELQYFVDDQMANRLKLALTNPSIREVTGDGVLGGALDVMSFIQGTIKLGKTAYSPVAHPRNIVGAGLQLTGMGNLLSPSGMKGFVSALQKRKDKDFADLMKSLGVTNTSVTMRQILNRLGPDFQSGRSPSNALAQAAYGIARAGKPGEFFRNVYQVTDDAAKMLAFLSERSRMDNIWKGYAPERRLQITDDMKTFLGRDKITEGEILDELAVRRALNTMPTYSRVPQFTEYLRGVPIVGNFMAYSLEIIRNSLKSMRFAQEEMMEGFATGNKALVASGANRLAAMAATNGGIAAGAYALNEINGTSDIREALTGYLEDWRRFNPIIVLPKEGTGKDAVTPFYDLGYLNPFSPIMQLVSGVQAGAVSGKSFDDTMNEYLVPALTQFLGPIIDPSLALEAGTELKNLFTAASEGEVTKSLGNFIRLTEPGFVKLGREFAVETGAFSPETELWLAPQYFGRRREDIDPEDFMTFLARKGMVGAVKKETFDIDATTGFALRSQAREFETKANEFSSRIKTLLENPANIDRTDYNQLFKDYEQELARQFAVQGTIADLLTDLKELTDNDPVAMRQIMADADLRSAIPGSKRERGRLLYNKSAVRRLSGNKQFWRDVLQDNPDFPVGKFRQAFNALENRYDNRNLESPPDLVLE